MKFTIEKNNHILQSDFKVLRNLYTPIIGVESALIYELFVDYSNLDNRIITYYPINDILQNMNMTNDQFIESRKKLEAVGLIRTYEKADNFHFIFVINRPLSPLQLKSNTILFNLIMSKISIEAFERIEYSWKTHKYSKSEFQETTLKFQDLFSIDKSPTKLENTLELPNKLPESIDEAIVGLNPAQFIVFLSNKRIQKSMLLFLSDLTNSAFSSRAINLIINYSYDVNGKVVKNHVKTIAMDLLNKDATTFAMVDEELTKALDNKTIEKIQKENEKPQKIKNGQININDIYNQIGDL